MVSIILIMIAFSSSLGLNAGNAPPSEIDRSSLDRDIFSCRMERMMQSNETCRKALYANEVFERFLLDTTNDGEISGDNMRLGNVNKEKYNVIFTDFILKGIPFNGSVAGGVYKPDYGSLRACFSSSAPQHKAMSGDKPIFSCASLNKEVLVPSVAANNYLFRVRTSEDESVREELDYSTMWPSLIGLSVGDPTNAYRCPAGLHQLLYAPVFFPSTATTATGAEEQDSAASSSSSSSSGPESSPQTLSGGGKSAAVRLRIFHASSAEHFAPSFGIGASTTDAGAVEANRRPLHVISYGKTGFPKLAAQRSGSGDHNDGVGAIAKKFALPKFIETTLESRDDYVLIPYGYLVSLVVEGELDSASSHHFLHRICIADASNLNLLRAHLLTSSAVSPGDGALHIALNASSLDVSMEMNAGDITLDTIRRRFRQASKGDIDEGASAGTGGGDENEVPTATSTGTSDSSGRTGRDSGGGSSFREWQEYKHWVTLVKSLTMQAPSLPTVRSMGRQNITAEWHSPYLPDAADQTRFGFEFQVCRVTEGRPADTLHFDAERDEEETSSSSPSPLSLCRKVLLTRGVSSSESLLDVLQESEDIAMSITEGHEVKKFSVTLGARDFLQPNTAYQFRMRLFYDVKTSFFSVWSEILRTCNVTAPSAVPGISFFQKSSTSSGTRTKSSANAGGKKKRRKNSGGAGTGSGSSSSLPDKRQYAVEAVAVEGSPSLVSLSFVKPFDDGGSPILGYKVYGRCVANVSGTGGSDEEAVEKQALPLAWIEMESSPASSMPPPHTTSPSPTTQPTSSYKGTLEYVNVRALLMNTYYEFKICAYNAIGVGPESEITNVVATGWPNEPAAGVRYKHLGFIEGTTQGYARGTAYTLSSSVRTLKPSVRVVSVDTISQSVGAGRIVTKDAVGDVDQDKVFRIDTLDVQLEVATQSSGWRCHWSPRAVALGEAVRAFPFMVDKELENSIEMRGKVVFLRRGLVPLVFKIRRVQAAGALAAVIEDDGTCTRMAFDQSCMPGASQSKGDGFAAHDLVSSWEMIRIPVVFIRFNESAILLPETGYGTSTEDMTVVSHAAPADVRTVGGNDEL